MADFNYLHTNCFEVTIEVGCEKFPLEEELFTIWHENKGALLNYMEMVLLCFYRLFLLSVFLFLSLSKVISLLFSWLDDAESITTLLQGPQCLSLSSRTHWWCFVYAAEGIEIED